MLEKDEGKVGEREREVVLEVGYQCMRGGREGGM